MAAPRTLFEKVWQPHVVIERDDGAALLWIDRHFVHEGSFHGFGMLDHSGRPLARPDLTFGVADHYVPSHPRSQPIADPEVAGMVAQLRGNARRHGMDFLDIDDPRQGIVHVAGPEQGLTLPGLTVVCGDSHTSTHGAFGALGFGIGASEVSHVLATQTLWQRRPRTLRVTATGLLGAHVAAKDLILAIIARIGAAGAVGHVIEYAGPAIAALGMEARMTLCNMSIEAGGRAGLVAPDAITFAWLEGRPRVPKGTAFAAAVAAWSALPSDPGAAFDREVALDASAVAPTVTWGTSPDTAVPVTAHVPDPGHRTRRRTPRRPAQAARLHGPPARHPARGPAHRPHLHRQLHQRPPPRPAGRRRRAPRPPRRRARPGRPRLHRRQAPGGGGRTGRRVPRRRAGVGGGGVFHVRRHERRPGAARAALRVHQQPQLRGPAGARRPHPPDVRRHGRSRGRAGCDHRRADRRMTPFTVLDGPAAALDLPNIDTDQIIPARFLRKPRSAGYGTFLFHDLRGHDPAYALAGIRILIAGENFGCGSSREGAVYALVDAGIRCVVAPSFGDIFAGNAAKNGLLTIALPVAPLIPHLPGRMAVDLPNQVLTMPGGQRHGFAIEPFRKNCLLAGLDDIGLTMEHTARIAAFAERDRAERPWAQPA